MKPIFTRNINKSGRLFRGAIAAILFFAAWYSISLSAWLGILLAASGGFALFEALRGWCPLRACGIKTRL
jgi:hypothetical protein